MKKIEYLFSQLESAGIPYDGVLDLETVDGISDIGEESTIDYASEATPAQVTVGNAILEAVKSNPAPAYPLAIADRVAMLEGLLRNTAFWLHLWTQMGLNNTANRCGSFLLIALTNTRQPGDLIFGFNTLRQALQTTPGLSDFSADHLTFLANALEQSGLDLPGLNLNP